MSNKGRKDLVKNVLKYPKHLFSEFDYMKISGNRLKKRSCDKI